jgi:hypothetical protein
MPSKASLALGRNLPPVPERGIHSAAAGFAAHLRNKFRAPLRQRRSLLEAIAAGLLLAELKRPLRLKRLNG